jgi:hypothetical protein
MDRAEHVIRLFDVTVAAQSFINSVDVLQHRWVAGRPLCGLLWSALSPFQASAFRLI